MDVLRVAFDVTSLSQDERDGLAGEVSVQGEVSDLHRGAAVVSCEVDSSCTGYLDEDHGGQLVHDGDTCPVHEDPPALSILEDALSHLSTYLAQARQQGIPLTLGDDDTGRGLLEHAVARVDEAYALLETASGTARVTAGPSPGRAAAEHRGVRAWVTLEDNPEHANYLVFRAFIDPPPSGLDELAYSHQAVRVPPEHRV